MSYSFGFILAGANLAAALLVWLYLYESSLLSLESVDTMYGIRGLAPWESSGWVPPGYVTRLQRDEKNFRGMNVSAASASGQPQEMVKIAKKDVKGKGKEIA